MPKHRLFTAMAGVLIACLLFLTGCSATPQGAEFNIIVASDLHYISSEICDNGAYFTDMMSRSDGKVSIYCTQLTQAFLSEVIRQKPDALILTGDVTFNGALQSHRDLASQLAQVERQGIEVLVLPGNHDVFNQNAARFHGDSFTRLRSRTTEDFVEIYGNFGYNQALSRDESSASYMYQLNSTTRVLMLDMNTREYPCALSPQTIAWADKQLEQAKKDGCYVFVAGHQNVLDQTFMTTGYTIWNAETLRQVLQRHGVQLVLSGHIHMQHQKTDGNMTEIVSSSLAVSPCQYGVLTARDGKIDYHTQPVNVSEWAAKNGVQDADLLDFAQFASDYMDNISRGQLAKYLGSLNISAEEQKALMQFAMASNRMFFAGDLRNYTDIDPEGSLLHRWQQLDSGRVIYLQFVANERGNDATHWKNY